MDSAYISSLDGLSHDGVGIPLSTNGDSLASRKANALSTKLATVLSSSYADSEIREALRLLDLRSSDNVEGTRHNLKANVQKEVIDANGRIIDDFGQVAEVSLQTSNLIKSSDSRDKQLKHVGALIDSLNRTCDEMRTHIVAAKQESAPVLEEASTLLARKQETEAKQNLLEAFRKHFLVSDYYLNILTNTTEPLNEDFFAILSRVKGIHRDCEILLGYENQRLGLELMEQATRNLDAGFKKLYTWIQREFKGLDLEDPHISGSIRRALRILSERPTLFQNCLDFFAEARESTLSDAFQAALTGSGQAQAIEFSTHDPLRYIGDMLAWVHSAAVSEKEALEGLFISDAEEISKGLAAGRASEPWARIKNSASTGEGTPDDLETDAVFDGQKALNDLVSRNLASVCQTLYSRVELAVRNAGDSVLTYKVYNLLTFCRDIFAKSVGSDTSISKIVLQLESFAMAQFEEGMEEEVAAVTADSKPTADLSPPAFLHATLKRFIDVCKARGPQTTTAELERLFTAMLTGVLDACAEGAMQLPDTKASNIYKINYLMALRAALRSLVSQVPPAALPLEKANNEIETLKSQMVEYVTSVFLEDSGVADVLQETDSRRDLQVRRQWLAENLESSAQKLDDFLSSGLMDAQDSLKYLVDKSFATEIVSDAVERFCSEFEELEGMLEASERQGLENGIEDDEEEESATSLREMYPRSVAEVKALLS